MTDQAMIEVVAKAMAESEGWRWGSSNGPTNMVDHCASGQESNRARDTWRRRAATAINHLPALLDRLEAAERGSGQFPDHSQRLAARMGGRLVPRDDIGAIINRSRAKYQTAACDTDLGRKERTRCSHYVQVLDEVAAAIREVKP